MLKLKLQYFDHLMRRADPLEKTLVLGKIKGKAVVLPGIQGGEVRGRGGVGRQGWEMRERPGRFGNPVKETAGAFSEAS